MFAYIDPGSGYVIASGFGYIIAVAVAFFGAILAFFRKRPKIIAAIILACILSYFGYRFVQGKTMTHEQLHFANRIVILGFDGMNPPTVEKMMREGKLPHLAGLAKTGSYRRLATTNPPQSPVAWAGFATGQNPGKHGLFDFIRRDPKLIVSTDPNVEKLKLSTSTFDGKQFQPVVTAKRFWDYATEGGVESVILNCPITFPPDKINGRILSGMGVPDIIGTEGTFTFYTTEPASPNEVGGKVVPIELNTDLVVDLYGPRRQTATGRDNVRVPMAIHFDPDAHTAQVEIKGGDRFTLKQGEWSDWHGVTFSLGLFQKMKGTLQFYLVQADKQQFKLYTSPINFDPRDPYYNISYPEGYSKELTEKFGLFYTQGMPNETWGMNEQRIAEQAFLDRLDKITDYRRKVLDLELGRVKQGIVFSYYDATDVVQHMFWRYDDPKSKLYDPHSPYANTIEDTYKKMDEIVGDVRKQLGPKDVLIVLSDHGFASFRRAANVNSWLHQHGYLAFTKGATTGTDQFDNVDWSKTRAYALGFGAVYLNLAGREAQGIVQPGAEAETLTNELTQKLLAWKDDDGSPLINHVYTRKQIFHGPRAGEMPDLFIGFHDGYRASWQTALGAAPEKVVEDNDKKWSGDHLIDPVLVPGILFTNKANIREQAGMYDLAPTILHAIGCSDEVIAHGDFDGEPLF